MSHYPTLPECQHVWGEVLEKKIGISQNEETQEPHSPPEKHCWQLINLSKAILISEDCVEYNKNFPYKRFFKIYV